jgi:hypothetical protein
MVQKIIAQFQYLVPYAALLNLIVNEKVVNLIIYTAIQKVLVFGQNIKCIDCHNWSSSELKSNTIHRVKHAHCADPGPRPPISGSKNILNFSDLNLIF